MRNSALVKVVSTGELKVPFDFPYRDFVRLSVLGDTEDLENLRFELTAIKDQVNRDISRFKMNLVDFRIVIKLELGE